MAQSLGALTVTARRLALVGLAKNTGKTVALTALLRELHGSGRKVGVTSVGRDGEEHDVIDFRIEKPAVMLAGGDLVATADGLLRASGIPHELIERTGIRTPLGEVLLARLKGAGTIEIAGPSAAADARAVADAMLEAGAEQVLIDGAIDRRAASSPAVADGLLMSTGAVLSEELDEVVARTADAVALVRVRALGDSSVRELAGALQPGDGALIDEHMNARPLPGGRFALTAEPAQVDGFLTEGPARPRWLIVTGAVPESFLRGALASVRRSRAPLTIVATDPTHVFLSEHGLDHYAAGGLQVRVLHPVDLRALTVNPVAPASHSFDSARLRAQLSKRIEGVPIFDVMHPSYAGAKPPSARAAASARSR
ncbi:MAG: lysine 5,6-aminomutase reactivase subunit KamB [Solirubrobacteraceae bacterium]